MEFGAVSHSRILRDTVCAIERNSSVTRGWLNKMGRRERPELFGKPRGTRDLHAIVFRHGNMWHGDSSRSPCHKKLAISQIDQQEAKPLVRNSFGRMFQVSGAAWLVVVFLNIQHMCSEGNDFVLPTFLNGHKQHI